MLLISLLFVVIACICQLSKFIFHRVSTAEFTTCVNDRFLEIGSAQRTIAKNHATISLKKCSAPDQPYLLARTEQILREIHDYVKTNERTIHSRFKCRIRETNRLYFSRFILLSIRIVTQGSRHIDSCDRVFPAIPGQRIAIFVTRSRRNRVDVKVCRRTHHVLPFSPSPSLARSFSLRSFDFPRA